MKAFLVLTLIYSATAFAHEAHEGLNRRSCPQAAVPNPAPTMEQLAPKLRQNRIEILKDNSVSAPNVSKFLTEYEKFPQSLRNEMIQRRARIRLMEGTGVGIDPSMTATVTTEGTRQWVDVPGAGGEVSPDFNIPTRIAVNHLYDKHGASNLVLHEHAHTLDSVHGRHSVSRSQVWMNLMNTTPKSAEFTKEICGQYCLDREEERFAELFSYYFACEDTRKHLEQEVPAIAEFFNKLTNVKSVIDGTDPRGNVAVAIPTVPTAPLVPGEECPTNEVKVATDAIRPLTDLTPHLQKLAGKAPASSISASGMK